ncbi:hypothetical protein ACA910_013431 [Epithemia clementina (nom. ined.)]
MGDLALESVPPPAQPPALSPPLYPSFPRQETAPKNLTSNLHGYVLRFKFQPPPTTAKHKCTPIDTFNAVEALGGLAEALFTAQGNVTIHNDADTEKLQSVKDWPSDHATFQRYFEVHVPDNGGTQAFVRLQISTSMEYRNLKKGGVIYNYLRTNNIFMTLHQFSDIEAAMAGIILFKNPKITYWPH